mmetsp:Transcript_24150/g.37256  ORF Transcript_24150/g.37256 Transcript_24150/m.37256 type:complete len:266 (+) Transcript_24150:117-914(+)|eukprot:CAMPEP_0118705404 /NCGR_PEP_ID=MMETSP0800-20121206/19847_1 /TAXON_ID=210618 ORGANISM="Striatella unipunctata, Strain CCMP2910" /NCGR_SAMPLE_ID=MMETSP0800 /ASSEMBLY_ACC=CAM_ASM_000638 /LENGTH=265 /DNA_ID=CAMNT_0006607551 /DNA_START=120 /DNA_END=917 /DNA_ORIENTATION=+
MPTKFSDIAKGPNDLIGDDFPSKTSLKVKKSAGPVAVTLETERSSKDGALSSKIATKFSYAGLSIDKLQATASGGYVLETSIKPAPGLSLAFKGNKGADLVIDYKTPTSFTTATLDVKDLSKFATSTCADLGAIKVGANASYDITGKALSSYNIGLGYTSGPAFIGVTTASKLSSANLALLYKVSPTVSIASTTTHSTSSVFALNAIGASYKAPFGTLKAKVGGSGVISASIVKDIAPKVTLTASGSASAKDPSGTFKYGVGLVM